MPGVVVNTAVRSAPTATNTAPAATYFVVGTAERGPLTPTFVTSLAQFEATYGTYNALYTLHQQLKTFFEEGGAQAYVLRVVSTDIATTPSSYTGSLGLVNGDDDTAIIVSASNPGSWSDDLEVAVVAGATTFVVEVYYRGENVFMTTPAATAGVAADEINNSAIATLYLSAAVQGANASTSLADSAAEPLVGGADDVDPTSAELLAGLDTFDTAYGSGAVAIPGSYSDVYTGLIQHAIDNSRIALLAIDPLNEDATDPGAILDDIPTIIEDIQTSDGPEYAAVYYPHVTIPGEGGVTLTISPESYVAAKRSIAQNSSGPWQAPAGVTSQADFVNGVTVPLTSAIGNQIDNLCVNAIRIIQNTIRIYGARSASTDTSNFRYITARDTLNYISAQAAISLEDLVFSTIDGRGTVFGRVESRLIAILEPMRSAGGLYEGFSSSGTQLDPGYSVEVSDALNPVTQLADGVVRAKVGVRVSSTGDRIVVDVIKSNLTSSVV